MKLTGPQIDQVREQLGVEPIPEDNPAVAELTELFGDHTFYLDPNGLHIWEQVENPEAAGPCIGAVKVASWSDEEKSGLTSHAPESTTAVVTLAADAPDPAA